MPASTQHSTRRLIARAVLLPAPPFAYLCQCCARVSECVLLVSCACVSERSVRACASAALEPLSASPLLPPPPPCISAQLSLALRSLATPPLPSIPLASAVPRAEAALCLAAARALHRPGWTLAAFSARSARLCITLRLRPGRARPPSPRSPPALAPRCCVSQCAAAVPASAKSPPSPPPPPPPPPPAFISVSPCRLQSTDRLPSNLDRRWGPCLRRCLGALATCLLPSVTRCLSLPLRLAANSCPARSSLLRRPLRAPQSAMRVRKCERVCRRCVWPACRGRPDPDATAATSGWLSMQ